MCLTFNVLRTQQRNNYPIVLGRVRVSIENVQFSELLFIFCLLSASDRRVVARCGNNFRRDIIFLQRLVQQYLPFTLGHKCGSLFYYYYIFFSNDMCS